MSTQPHNSIKKGSWYRKDVHWGGRVPNQVNRSPQKHPRLPTHPHLVLECFHLLGLEWKLPQDLPAPSREFQPRGLTDFEPEHSPSLPRPPCQPRPSPPPSFMPSWVFSMLPSPVPVSTPMPSFWHPALGLSCCVTWGRSLDFSRTLLLRVKWGQPGQERPPDFLCHPPALNGERNLSRQELSFLSQANAC